MADVDFIEIGRKLAERFQRHPTAIGPLLTMGFPDTLRKALNAAQQGEQYFAAAALGVPEEEARAVLDAAVERARGQGAALQAAFGMARERLFAKGGREEKGETAWSALAKMGLRASDVGRR